MGLGQVQEVRYGLTVLLEAWTGKGAKGKATAVAGRD